MKATSFKSDSIPENHNFSTRKKLAFTAVIVFGFFALTEIFLILINFPGARSLESEDQKHWLELGYQQDESLPWSWIPIPGARETFADVSYQFNLSGFRGTREIIDHKSENLLRVVCMGDSCTMGWEVENDEPFCHQLQIMLQASLSKQVETINGGVPGYTSFQGLHQLETRILPLDPDVIIFSYNWNDHTFAIHMHETLKVVMHESFFGMPDKDLPGKTFYSEIHSAMARLRSYQLVDHVLEGIRSKDPESVEAADNKPIDVNQVPVRVSVSDYKANLREMIALARENDITPILMTQPSQRLRSRHASRELANSLGYIPQTEREWERFDSVMGTWFEREQREYNAAILDVAEETGARLVDLVPVFDPIRNSEVLLDPVHPTPKGHRLIARELETAILESLKDGI